MNEEYVIVYLNFYIYIYIYKIIYLKKIWQKNEGFFFKKNKYTHTRKKERSSKKKRFMKDTWLFI